MFEKELEAALKAGENAIKGIMEIYSSPFEVEIKADNSPVTKADKNADIEIRKYLSKLFPSYAFLTEESNDDLKRLDNDFVWIIDPVDGTKDFVAKDDEFTTNIALAYKHEVVVGVIVAPAKNEFWFARKNGGAFHRINGKDFPIHVNNKTKDLTCLTSVFHLQESEIKMMEKHKDLIKKSAKVGSSLKACEIASGNAEISYRLSNGTKEWDIAASDIIVSEAGGLFLKPDLTKYKYNRKDVYNREGYIIVNRKENILL